MTSSNSSCPRPPERGRGSACIDRLRRALRVDRPVAIQTAVSEAVGNAVVHAYPTSANGSQVWISAELDRDGLLVAVEDEGTGMRPRVDSPGLGLGISLIERLTDRLVMEDRSQGGLRVERGSTASHTRPADHGVLTPTGGAARLRPGSSWTTRCSKDTAFLPAPVRAHDREPGRPARAALRALSGQGRRRPHAARDLEHPRLARRTACARAAAHGYPKRISTSPNSSRFDFVAVQEVNDLPEWARVIRILGPDWDFIAADVTDPELGGNGERVLTFAFDSRRGAGFDASPARSCCR